MSHAHEIKNDLGTVKLTPQLVEAIRLIQDSAWTLQMTPGEFLDCFADGIPECPECKKDQQK
jgi:hypothetical protein